MDRKPVVGVDIGGANIKFARSDIRHPSDIHTSDGQLRVPARSVYFPMWTDSSRLGDVLREGFATFGEIAAIVVTMTGELADCFLDRAEGVHFIAAAVCQAADALGIRTVTFYGADGRFRDHQQIGEAVDLIAAANWHATASYAAKTLCDGEGLLIDIGSTTTDLIPIRCDAVATDAKTDHQRLVEGSLVYIGCGRTPVCSVVSKLTFAGQSCPLMNEGFATMDDAMVVLGMGTEDPQDCCSADGRPRTTSMAANRIARMVGLDHRAVSIDSAKVMANEILDASRQIIEKRFSNLDRGGTLIVAGHGSRLLRIPVDRSVIKLDERFGPELSRCFPAYAVACLWELE